LVTIGQACEQDLKRTAGTPLVLSKESPCG
jgi:hypothetical protein